MVQSQKEKNKIKCLKIRFRYEIGYELELFD